MLNYMDFGMWLEGVLDMNPSLNEEQIKIVREKLLAVKEKMAAQPKTGPVARC